MPNGAATQHLYRPKLLSVLSEGYGLDSLRRDAIAGLTVAVVALPLSMAIAVASGVSPERGLYAAIAGGFVVSALGGSRFQIGGPAAAFIGLVASAVATLGLSGLLLAVLVSGVLLVLLGLTRLGGLVRRLPHAVTVGFTAAIAISLIVSQLKDLGGLVLSGPEPAALGPKLLALAAAAHTLNPAALGLGLGAAVVIVVLRRWRPGWPVLLIALVLAALVATAPGVHVETLGSRFGTLPRGLPAPTWPPISWALLVKVFPTAVAFTILGAIESLLSAKVADGLTGRRHRANMELVAQGAANVASALFGGVCVTGTIARTATNVRAGARTPLAGMLHSVLLLGLVAVAAPLIRYVPLAGLGGLLLVVAFTMVEPREVARLLRHPASAAVLATTVAVTLVSSLIAGIAAGWILAAVFGALGLRLEAEAVVAD
ncbi:MAG: SulP family inorganic anion transporter [Phenylobacterium sp.]